MADPFIGEIRLFPFATIPSGWQPCNGQLIAISQNQALFAILGTAFGGDGIRTFALPNLQGRASVGAGQGPGLMPVQRGQVGGEAAHTLTQSEMPAHNHMVNASSNSADNVDPTGRVWASQSNTYGSSPNTQLSSTSVLPMGQSQPHENMQPYLALSFCIATAGIFPPHP